MSDPAVALDLDPSSRAALDFDELLEWIADHARTAPGRKLVLALQPTTDPAQLAATLATVREFGRLLEEHGQLVPGSLPDPGPALSRLSVAGRQLDAGELRALAAVARGAGEVGAEMRGLAAADYPRLRELAAGFPDLRHEADRLLRYIEPDGTLSDDASPELRRIRQARARSGERLRAKLESFLHRPDAENVIRDDFITQRNGRFVIPVRSDSPRPVRGIVHATSSSGATQFVEPLETVELNNELVRLAELEQREIERLLLAWSEIFRARRVELDAAIDGLAALDSLQARALFGRQLGGTTPRIEPEAPLVLDELRHPLLERTLAEQGRQTVPLTVTLDPADRVLVLSGPNAGGKTVALKTFGIAVLMAQSGIPVPARDFGLPLYRQIRADIGDHQSMQADLSTFSAHVRAVAGFLAQTTAPTLLLFDEIGGGTDPSEGAALARAILESIARPGITAVATTHQSSLKAWAYTSERALSAAMEFDTEKLRPTYRVIPGAAGVSAGLEIATRFGLADDIVDRAKSLLGRDSQQAEDYLNRLHRMTRELERKHEEADRRAAESEQRLVRRQRSLEQRAERQQRQAREELDRALREFRRDARRQLAELGDRRERQRAERRLGKLEDRLRGQRARLGHEAGLDEQRAGPAPQRLEPGMEVYVRSLGRQGRIQRIAGRRVEVLLGRMPFTVDRSELRMPAASAAPSAEDAPSLSRPAAALAEDRVVASELLLIGKTIDEGLAALDKFLDDASIAGLAEVRVIHGHGTGRLRRAVREFLAGHPHVAAHRPGRAHEGGDGATVVKLG